MPEVTPVAAPPPWLALRSVQALSLPSTNTAQVLCLWQASQHALSELDGRVVIVIDLTTLYANYADSSNLLETRPTGPRRRRTTGELTFRR